LNVGSLQALGAADNLEFNGLSLVEGAVAVRLNRGEMDENVLAALALDESKAFAGVKPLYCSLFFHRIVPLIKKAIWCTLFPESFQGSRASFADSPRHRGKAGGKQRRPQAELAALKQKAKQEQQTHL
jgi:hypothetical protein